MEAKNKKSILLMIYMFSFIIMLFGATFSYFTARARSQQNALEVQAGRLKLSLEVVSKHAGENLIPTEDTDIMKAYHNNCVDDKGRTACAAYDLILTNESVKQDVIGVIDFEINHIENLSYLVLDENENMYQNITKIEKSTKNMPLGGNFILEDALEKKTPTKKKFTLLIWLSNVDRNQIEEDANGTYSASIKYNSIYGQKLSSIVSGSKGV